MSWADSGAHIANSAFHPSGVDKYGPALAVKAEAGMAHKVNIKHLGMQVKHAISHYDVCFCRGIPLRNNLCLQDYKSLCVRLLQFPTPWLTDRHTDNIRTAGTLSSTAPRAA